MLINWQPVLGRGTSKSVLLPLKKQVESQRLNMFLGLQMEIEIRVIHTFFCNHTHMPLRFALLSSRKIILQAWTACFVAYTFLFFLFCF